MTEFKPTDFATLWREESEILKLDPLAFVSGCTSRSWARS